SKEMTVEPRLVEAILNEVVAGRNPWLDRRDDQSKEIPKPATERIEAAFLQLVLYRLWDEEIGAGSRILQEKTLTQLGGAKEIVRDHLKSALAALSAAEQEAAANVFRYLVTSSGTKIAHTAKDLADYARISEAELKPLLDKLSAPEKRILRPVSTRTDLYEITRYEIFHDVLGPAIVEWEKAHLRVKEAAEAAKKAAEEAREAARRRELEQAQKLAEEQQHRLRDKVKAARRLKRMNWGLMAAGL